jgi:hypothetical protein
MYTITLHARVDHGTLHITTPIHVPDDVPDGDHEIVIAMQSTAAPAIPRAAWPAGFFEQTYGALADLPIERPDQGVLEERDPLL